MGILKGFLVLILGILITTLSFSGTWGGICAVFSGVSGKAMSEIVIKGMNNLVGGNVIGVIIGWCVGGLMFILGTILGIVGGIICWAISTVFGIIIGIIFIIVGFLKLFGRN